MPIAKQHATLFRRIFQESFAIAPGHTQLIPSKVPGFPVVESEQELLLAVGSADNLDCRGHASDVEVWTHVFTKHVFCQGMD